jgi:hypothetical protein
MECDSIYRNQMHLIKTLELQIKKENPSKFNVWVLKFASKTIPFISKQPQELNGS